MDLFFAKQVARSTRRITSQRVMVTNGERMTRNALVKRFAWEMEGGGCSAYAFEGM